MYTVIIVIFSIIVIGQFWYIMRLRAAIRYAAAVLEKFKAALEMDDIIRKATDNESKADKDVSK